MKNKLTSLLLVLLLIITAMPISAISADYDGDFYYEISNGSATITGYDGKATALVLPGTLGDCPVTAVASNAFSSPSIQSIVLPDSLSAVAEDSFSSESLRSISVGEENPVFSSKDGVLYSKEADVLIRYPAGKTNAVFTMPAGLLSIAPRAFKDLSAAVSVTVAHSVTEIGESAFENASALTLNSLPSNLAAIGNKAFKGASKLTLNTIPASMRTIGDNAFEDCSALTIFTIHEGLVSIGREAFKGCDSLRAVILPTTVAEIGQDAFVYTPAMTYFGAQPGNQAFSVSGDVLYSADGKTLIKYPEGKADESFAIPDTVTAVQNNAFAFTQNLLYLTAGAGLRTVTAGAFRDCTSILRINFPQNLAEIDVTTFNGCTSLRAINVDYLNPRFISDGAGALYNKDCTILLRLPEGYPSTVFTPAGTLKAIGNYAARNCRMLQQIKLPETVESIGYGAFYGCENLLSFNLPRDTAAIDDYAFYSCSRLAEVSLNEALADIGSKAFYGCSALTEITAPDSLRKIGVSAFEQSGLSLVQLNGGLETVAESAFASTPIAEISIPESVKTIGARAFFNCAELTAVNVDPANENYKSDSGVLYTSNGVLELYPMAKAAEKYIVLNDTERISSLAFYQAKQLGSVKLPKSVSAIASDSFNGITESVTIIGYTGTEAESFAEAHGIAFVALDANPTDILISSVGPVKSDEIYDGEEILFTCTVRNIGDYDTADTLTVDFYVNGQLLESVAVDRIIASGRSAVLYTSLPYKTVFGNTTVTAIVNDDENVAETDFSNNRMKKRFLIV